MGQRQILKGKECPYCGMKPEMVDSSEVYSKSYGNIYLCRPCRSWVGVHKHDDKPLGRLANAELRKAKRAAHYYFDQLWTRKIKQGFKKNHARSKAYKWLSVEMKTKPEFTHIGMFDVSQCNRVVEICKPYIK